MKLKVAVSLICPSSQSNHSPLVNFLVMKYDILAQLTVLILGLN